MITSPILQVEHLHFAHGKQGVLVDVGLTLAAGDFVALIGPNGSGKTTLLRCLAGILAPSAGRILVCGHDLATDPQAAKRALGFAVDPGHLPPLLTGRECVRLFASTRALTEIPEATLSLCDALALTPMLDRRVGNYSLGMRQKLGILLGLIDQPPLLLLDEPINGLDPISAYALKRQLQLLTGERGTAVLLATHALDIAERFATRAMLLMDGRIARQWSSVELDGIRSDPDQSLEQSMLQALA